MITLNNSYLPQGPERRYRGITFVIGFHLLLAWAMISGTAQKTLDILKKPLETVVIQEVIIPPPEQPSMPKVVRPVEPLAQKMPLVQQVTTEAPQPSAAKPQESAPEPVTPTATKIAVAPPATTAPRLESSQPKTVSMEGEYLGMVRTMLNATKRYPTGRQASQQRPYGTVRVWFTLSRNGTLIDAGVIASSNSNLLDDAALSSVRRSSYPPFPATTWPGQEQHKFSADIEFAPASAG